MDPLLNPNTRILCSLSKVASIAAMEELVKLEKVQTMLSFIDSRSLSTSDQHSDRFLANFLLFLVQPFEPFNMKKKCDLISEFVQKAPAAILEEALFLGTEERTEPIQSAVFEQTYGELPPRTNFENKSDLHLQEADSEKMAKIGLDAMQRANSTLEDFCRSYFMFHGMDVSNPDLIFRYLPVLSFTESYIYQLDTMNEKDLQCLRKEVVNGSVAKSSYAAPRPDPFDPLAHLLQCHGLLTERLRTELNSGVEYWELERKLCHALMSKKKILIEDVMRAIHLKSFDYRVLNLLLYQLRGQQVNDLHMEFLSVSEFLVEISDDLYDYEDDVMDSTFNILRMFVGVYGASKASSMLAKCITEAEERYAYLSKSLEPELSFKYSRRCEEATREGGMTSGHTFGTWNIPPVIADEDLFRLRIINKKTLENTY